ncbi:MAG: hypothetical protein HY763_13940 [Planctomycetes bacterium]|nr:hypothetical protein [Planctomycetota bacterium]
MRAAVLSLLLISAVAIRSSSALADPAEWVIWPSNPVLTGSNNQSGGASVLKIGGVYHVWHDDAASGATRIMHATSSDGYSWSVSTAVAASPTVAEDAHPEVVLCDNTYYLWSGNFSNTRLLTSPDGITWANQGQVQIGAQQGWATASVVCSSGTPKFTAWYRDSGTSYQRATSNDGVSWTNTGVALPNGSPGSFDETLSHLDVLESGGLLMVYAALQGAGPPRFAYATSPDGITWSKQGLVSMDYSVLPPGTQDVSTLSLLQESNGLRMWFHVNNTSSVWHAWESTAVPALSEWGLLVLLLLVTTVGTLVFASHARRPGVHAALR